jgi:hypothetical protein
MSIVDCHGPMAVPPRLFCVIALMSSAPAGKAKVEREGSHVTVVCAGRATDTALQAATHLAAQGQYPTQIHTYIHTYHSRFIPDGVAEVPQIFLRDAHVLPKLFSYEKYSTCNKW